MSPRQDLITSAVTFLRDPSVASSPVEKRIEFLKSKNLTQEEIDLALSQASSSVSSHPSATSPSYYPPPPQAYPSPYPPQYYGQQWPPAPQEPPRRDWRDYFILATTVTGASWALYVLANRYIKPLIAPPTPPQLEQDKQAIDAQFDRAFALLDTLAEDTQKLKDAEEARTKRLDDAITDIEKVVADLKAAKYKQEDDMRRMENEVRGVKEALPRTMEAVREGNEKQLKELVTELGSLKTLMAGRSSYTPPTIPKAPQANVNSYISSNTQPRASGLTQSSMNTSDVSASSAPNPTANSHGTSSSSYTPTPNAAITNPVRQPTNTNLGYGSSKVSIPAWQLAAQKKNDEAQANSNKQEDGADAVAALASS